MSVTDGNGRPYKDAWDGFWREAPAGPGAVFWDADPAHTAAPHLDLFRPYLTEPGLPLVDLGCGNGTQTRFLAARLPGPVVGVDVSAAALEQARAQDADGAARYRVLDAADGGAAAGLHAELGESNVYMRGVLHQTPSPEARDVLAGTIATLLGDRGRAFVVEPAEAAARTLGTLMQGPSGPPGKLLPVLKHGIVPGTVADAAVPEHFRTAGLRVLASGELPLATTETGPDGTPIVLPSLWLVVGRG
ncbi:class I SAM-dependent methyltransferase [Streptomyces sp. MUM 203J]|uniref:class I SAM-dependent methyltransferase n=1 Tax=Streptomyces sp. MUM 203J TaxID=2791990 RepID=UPI001F04D7F7|nr:class I SAM-dependent methyltransferase [Streptomyces sp. MUM 203J]MCH0543031.1 class I SAM-dependent methyltransferase [Streptomyces sp. MUM 203J]